jgi:hypothetical protein
MLIYRDPGAARFALAPGYILIAPSALLRPSCRGDFEAVLVGFQRRLEIPAASCYSASNESIFSRDELLACRCRNDGSDNLFVVFFSR